MRIRDLAATFDQIYVRTEAVVACAEGAQFHHVRASQKVVNRIQDYVCPAAGEFQIEIAIAKQDDFGTV